MAQSVRFNADGEDYTRSGLSIGNAYTVVCWVKIAVDRNAFSTAWGLDSGSSANALALQTTSGGTQWMMTWEGGSTVNVVNATVGTWYGIGIVITNGTSGTWYWRTDQSATITSGAITNIGVAGTRTTLRIGESGWGTEWLNGNIAGLQVYTRALTAGEVATELSAQMPGGTADLYAAYPFDAGPSTADASGNNRTLSGGAGTSSETGPSIPLTLATTHQGAVALTATPSFSATAFKGQTGSAVLTATPSISVTGRVTGHAVRVSLTATPTIAVTARQTMFPTINLIAQGTWLGAARQSRTPILRTVFPYPSPEHPFRLIAQNILTGEFVDWDLPVDNDFEYQLNLSGPCVMSGAFKPDIISVQELGLDGYAYFFHVEISGQIRATGIFLPPRYEESGLSFTCEGFSAIPHYVTWQSTFSQVGVDPFSVIRSIWNHVQSVPSSNVGVTVSNTSTPTKLGTAATTETITNSNGETTTRDVPAEPYELMWWDAVNCGKEIDTLLNLAPGDYRERSEWNANKTNILKYVDLGYPRIGSARSNILFNEENIHELVPVQEPEDAYASEVIVIGAGDGVDTIKGYAAGSLGGRIRKTHVVTDKTVKTTQRANALALEELNIRRARAFEISEIVISAYHTNAPLGTYDIGDDILVSVDVPWMFETYSAWYRITSISFKPSGRHVRLGLARSDSFRYSTPQQAG